MISSNRMLIYSTLCLFGYAIPVLFLLFFCNEVESKLHQFIYVVGPVRFTQVETTK